MPGHLSDRGSWELYSALWFRLTFSHDDHLTALPGVRSAQEPGVLVALQNLSDQDSGGEWGL